MGRRPQQLQIQKSPILIRSRAKMKVEIQSKKFIKPSIPTPNLGHHNLSFLDEVSPKILILYYQAPSNANNIDFKVDKHALFSTHKEHLEKSLAQTLVHFYPLAGKYVKDLHVVDCNDHGVEFVEAKADCHLHEITAQGEKLDTKLLNNFISCEILTDEETTLPLLAVQVTMFECGGFSLGISILHRIADASTLSLFIQAWTRTATLDKNQQDGVQEFRPSYDSACFFPKRGLPQINIETTTNGSKIVTRRVLFHNKAISALRAIAGESTGSGRPISKVQLVNAVLWKAFVNVEKLKDENSRASLILQPVNIREKTTPPVPKNCSGNLFLLAMAPVMVGENKEIRDLAEQLTDSVKESFEEFAKIMSLGENDPFVRNMMNSLVNYYMITSWSRFPFYEADFGWGKPIWTSGVSMPIKKWICLMDDKDGDGIVAWVNLKENDMLIFEQDCNIQALIN